MSQYLVTATNDELTVCALNIAPAADVILVIVNTFFALLPNTSYCIYLCEFVTQAEPYYNILVIIQNI